MNTFNKAMDHMVNAAETVLEWWHNQPTQKTIGYTGIAYSVLNCTIRYMLMR